MPNEEEPRRTNDYLGLVLGVLGVTLLALTSEAPFPTSVVVLALFLILVGLRSAWSLWRHRSK